MRKWAMTRLSAVALMQFPIEDQFNRKIEWQNFDAVPTVVVVAGKKAAMDAKEWGIHLQKRFNGGFTPKSEHLQLLDEREKVKVIALATLPDVPGIFKGLFRSGFRRESNAMGVGLDFSSRLSAALGYESERDEPCVALFPPGIKAETPVTPEIVCGKVTDEAAVQNVNERLASWLKTR